MTLKERDYRGPLYLCFGFGTSRGHIKTGIKPPLFLILLVLETALCLLMDAMLRMDSSAVLPHSSFNLIVRETLWKFWEIAWSQIDSKSRFSGNIAYCLGFPA